MSQPITIKELLSHSAPAEGVVVAGWVRTRRGSTRVTFLDVCDGSQHESLQVVCDHAKIDHLLLQKLLTGSSVRLQGDMVRSLGSQQKLELAATHLQLLGESVDYPLQPKKHGLNFLRSLQHLRPRTQTISALLRIRSS